MNNLVKVVIRDFVISIIPVVVGVSLMKTTYKLGEFNGKIIGAVDAGAKEITIGPKLSIKVK